MFISTSYDDSSSKYIQSRLLIQLKTRPDCLWWCQHDTAIGRIHLAHLMTGDSVPGVTPSQPIWTMSQPIGCYHPHLPYTFIIITSNEN